MEPKSRTPQSLSVDIDTPHPRGWVCIYRSLLTHWLWKGERFSRGQAWIDLLLHTAFADHSARLGSKIVTIKRGQIPTSQVKLAQRWGWNRKSVIRFLRVLTRDNMISVQTDKGRDTGHTLITILNFDTYQNGPQGDGAFEGTFETETEGHFRDILGTLHNKENKETRTKKETASLNGSPPLAATKGGSEYGYTVSRIDYYAGEEFDQAASDLFEATGKLPNDGHVYQVYQVCPQGFLPVEVEAVPYAATIPSLNGNGASRPVGELVPVG